MMRKAFVLTALLLLLLALAVPAPAEEEVATPTELTCVHEHLRTTIYFFDSPAYTSLGPASHRVSGKATVETVCLDCGDVLYSEVVEDAEEVRPHSMKKGECALCGYRQKVAGEIIQRPTLPGELTVLAQEDDGGLLSLILTETDMMALQNARVTTTLVRGSEGLAAVAMDLSSIRALVRETGASLEVEIVEREDGSFFASLHLTGGEAEEPEDAWEGVTIRFYPEQQGEIRFAMASPETDVIVELEGDWNENGYWSVPYVGEGTYFLLR